MGRLDYKPVFRHSNSVIPRLLPRPLRVLLLLIKLRRTHLDNIRLRPTDPRVIFRQKHRLKCRPKLPVRRIGWRLQSWKEPQSLIGPFSWNVALAKVRRGSDDQRSSKNCYNPCARQSLVLANKQSKYLRISKIVISHNPCSMRPDAHRISHLSRPCNRPQNRSWVDLVSLDRPAILPLPILSDPHPFGRLWPLLMLKAPVAPIHLQKPSRQKFLTSESTNCSLTSDRIN
ncbi:hypothetical protein PGTUg99_026580 [Puccinia graminis f. sp. tritici]|uniref:Uncharacterized protein n=1 Tax=Puccinia graminis f. sp. tritici TaxID=56615 RepID=A0A5B0P3K3_PUCGR|nr:hypothetical protein PGTUg99_026580 [Puccinia graminis f. sp. tritici]